MCITPPLNVEKDLKDLPQNPKKNNIIDYDDYENCNDNCEYNIENNDDENDNNVDIDNHKKISLIEFLYKDKEPSNATLNISTLEGSEKSVKLSKLRAWLGAELKEVNKANQNSSKALVLYKSPYELFKESFYKYLLLYPNLTTKLFPLQIQELTDDDSNLPHKTTIEIQEIDDDECEDEEDKMVGEENFEMEKQRTEMDAGIFLKKGFMFKNNLSRLELQKGA